MKFRFFLVSSVYDFCRDFLGRKKAFTINDCTDICGDRLTTVSVHVRARARAVEMTDACLTSQCHVLPRKCNCINHLVLCLEGNTKRAAGLSVNDGEVSS